LKNVAVVEWGVVEGAKGSLMEGHYERSLVLCRTQGLQGQYAYRYAGSF
jgi:hypothetical protein